MRRALAVLVLVLALNHLAAANPSDQMCHTLGKHRVDIDIGTWGEDGHLVGFELLPAGRKQLQIETTTVIGFWSDSSQVLLRAHDNQSGRDTVLFKYDLKHRRGTLTANLPTLRLDAAKVVCD